MCLQCARVCDVHTVRGLSVREKEEPWAGAAREPRLSLWQCGQFAFDGYIMMYGALLRSTSLAVSPGMPVEVSDSETRTLRSGQLRQEAQIS